MMTTLDLSNRLRQAQLADIFLLNFLWIPTVVLAVVPLARGASALRGRGPPEGEQGQSPRPGALSSFSMRCFYPWPFS